MGWRVGRLEGDNVGLRLAKRTEELGPIVGTPDGLDEGVSVGEIVGVEEGPREGTSVGARVEYSSALDGSNE